MFNNQIDVANCDVVTKRLQITCSVQYSGSNARTPCEVVQDNQDLNTFSFRTKRKRIEDGDKHEAPPEKIKCSQHHHQRYAWTCPLYHINFRGKIRKKLFVMRFVFFHSVSFIQIRLNTSSQLQQSSKNVKPPPMNKKESNIQHPIVSQPNELIKRELRSNHRLFSYQAL